MISALKAKKQVQFNPQGEHSKPLLQNRGFVKLPNYLTDDLYSKLVEDIDNLKQNCLRKDFIMPGYETPRNLSVAGGTAIHNSCPYIISLYNGDMLLDLLKSYTGKQAYIIDHPEECIVVNTLSENGDTHGWHLDDPRYAFVAAIEVPEEGGVIELIPDWKKFDENIADLKLTFDEKIQLARDENLVLQESLGVGDAYILDASNTLHRITPLVKGTRTIINFAFHDAPSITYGDTATLLYSK